MEKTYCNLNSLSKKLNLPKTYLKRLTKNGLIPSLNVNGRLRFNPSAVEIALDQLASKGIRHESDCPHLH